MSVELYPNHKAILNYYHSLKVFEIDFLAYLTEFLAQDKYALRQFEIYVKPTLNHTAFDFIVVEPGVAIYIIQTPENEEEYQFKKENLKRFLEEKIDTLSVSLHKNLNKLTNKKQKQKKNAVIKQFFYVFDKEAIEELTQEEKNEALIVSVEDFKENSAILTDAFEKNKYAANRLTSKETKEIRYTLNPNTNIKNFFPKKLPIEYEKHAESQTQTKQKFKGTTGSGKTLLLTKRIIHCANRLNNSGKILVLAGKETEQTKLKDYITAEAGRSLQELGIDIQAFSNLIPPTKKYQALFIDDAEYLEPKDLEQLLNEYLVPMTEQNDYEYVVTANSEALPTIPQIFGRFITLNKDLKRIDKLLGDSREIFLEILNA